MTEKIHWSKEKAIGNFNIGFGPETFATGNFCTPLPINAVAIREPRNTLSKCCNAECVFEEFYWPGCEAKVCTKCRAFWTYLEPKQEGL